MSAIPKYVELELKRYKAGERCPSYIKALWAGDKLTDIELTVFARVISNVRSGDWLDDWQVPYLVATNGGLYFWALILLKPEVNEYGEVAP